MSNEHESVQRTRLSERRRAAGMTQEDLANGLKLDQSFVSRMEAGIQLPSLRVAIQIETMLGVAPRELVADFDRVASIAASKSTTRTGTDG